MEGLTVRGFYDNGELRFAEPVDLDGSWKLEIIFLEEVDEKSIPFEANPHRPKTSSKALENAHGKLDDLRGDYHPTY